MNRKFTVSSNPARMSAIACLAVTMFVAQFWDSSALAESYVESLSTVSRGCAALTQIRPRQLTLSPTRPPGIRKAPKGIKSPVYTTIDLGPKDRRSRFIVLLDAPDNGPSTLYVDSNGNGDLTDDPAPEWTHKPYTSQSGSSLVSSVGGAMLQVRYGTLTIPMHVVLSRNDTTEPPRAPQFLPIYCTADYSREGTIALSGKRFHVWLADALTGGDFRGSGVPGQTGVFLLIDVNGNGKIDPRGESYDVSQPFNIGGNSYEIHGLDADGKRLEIVESSRQVTEILPPPDLSVGKKVPAFEMTDTNGHRVKFPDDYKGKRVLLYFWATWCGDCTRENPYLISAYRQYHSKGLEVLGVSLDHENQAAQLKAYTSERGMEWPELYDGKVWDAAVAQLYYVRHTPTPLLVDGTTGTIIAGEPDLLGDRLAETLKKEVAGR